MTEKHLITREIGIDMGHRVTFHGSKCRNLHGHRYTVQVTCEGPLFTDGEQQGMVLDFGFLKEEMMNEIDTPCDHGMCLWINDPWAEILAGDISYHRQQVAEHGYCAVQRSHNHDTHDNLGGKFYLVPFVPTAENLARHWFERLAPRIEARTNEQATIKSVKVWETPNCTATYPA